VDFVSYRRNNFLPRRAISLSPLLFPLFLHGSLLGADGNDSFIGVGQCPNEAIIILLPSHKTVRFKNFEQNNSNTKIQIISNNLC
jgi:hypothetical protein